VPISIAALWLTLVPVGKSWRTSRPALYKSKVSVFADILHRRYLAGFLFQGAIRGEEYIPLMKISEETSMIKTKGKSPSTYKDRNQVFVARRSESA